MAGIKAVIQDVLAKLTTLQIVDGNGQKNNLYSRVWNNQIRQLKHGETYAYPHPASFLEILPGPKYLDIGVGYEEIDLELKIHLAHEYYNDVNGQTQEQNLVIFDLRDSIVTLLEDYQPVACSLLVRTYEEQDYTHDNIYHYIISFVCNFIDSKGSKDDQGKYIIKPPATGLQILDNEVPAINPSNPDITIYKIPQ